MKKIPLQKIVVVVFSLLLFVFIGFTTLKIYLADSTIILDIYFALLGLACLVIMLANKMPAWAFTEASSHQQLSFLDLICSNLFAFIITVSIGLFIHNAVESIGPLLVTAFLVVISLFIDRPNRQN
jgi:hypothetical protein